MYCKDHSLDGNFRVKLPLRDSLCVIDVRAVNADSEYRKTGQVGVDPFGYLSGERRVPIEMTDKVRHREWWAEIGYVNVYHECGETPCCTREVRW